MTVKLDDSLSQCQKKKCKKRINAFYTYILIIVLLFILQASIPSVIGDKDDDGRGDGEKDENGLLLPELEERLWVPHGKNKLADMDTDKFLIIARSVGTFARALDCSSSVKQPSLHMSAAAASRDVTLFHAHQLLHKVSKY